MMKLTNGQTVVMADGSEFSNIERRGSYYYGRLEKSARPIQGFHLQVLDSRIVGGRYQFAKSMVVEAK
jgi:hypothetical protein